LAPIAESGARSRLFRRITGLAAILLVELIAFRTWLNTVSLDGAGTLANLVVPRGPGTFRYVIVRCVVAFAMASLIFGDAKVSHEVEAFARLVRQRISWPLLLSHAAVALLFAGLCSILFGPRIPNALDGALVALWIVTGVASVGLAALAVLPAPFWMRLLRTLRRVLIFAFFVAVGVYVLSRLALTFWEPLSRGTLGLTYAMLHPVVRDLTVDSGAFVIGARDFYVQIAAECSGFEGLGLILVFTSAWLVFHRAEWRFPQALLLVPGGLIVMWLLNSVRVAALVWIGIAGAPDIAMGGFHSQAGWVAFTIVALGICVVARRVPWMTKRGENAAVPGEIVSNPTAPFVAPFMVILASALVAQLGARGFEWLYPIRVVASAAVLWYFARNYRALDWRIGGVSLGLGCLVFVIWLALEPLVTHSPAVAVPQALSQAPAAWRVTWLAFRVLGAVVTVPLAEELAFRGFLMRRFDAREFQAVAWQSVSWLAIALSSLTFGVMHGERWVAGTIAGVLYAVAVRRRGSLGDAVAAHATTNALIAGWVLIGGHWQFW
jgi:exosortase E/protease (VPEID-CTERM system)